MIIPKYLNKNDKIGVVALSCGVLEKQEDYNLSKSHYINEGFEIVESANLMTGGCVAGSEQVRAEELTKMFKDKGISGIAIARGGDFLFDMLEYFDFKIVKDNVKWVWGTSDPTSLLFILTTVYDIATIYSPCNMTGFDSKDLLPYQENFMEILKGNLVKQYMYPYKEIKPFTKSFTKKNKWININGEVDVEGTLLGGCIDVLKDVIGTKYDNVKEYVKDKDIIWYFDVFSMKSEDLYKTLLQFKYAGWFDTTKLMVFGPVCFPNSEYDLKYEDMIKKVGLDIPMIWNYDLGHVKPSFTMINGMKARIVNNCKESSMEYL